jgi:hypothetical protein
VINAAPNAAAITDKARSLAGPHCKRTRTVQSSLHTNSSDGGGSSSGREPAFKTGKPAQGVPDPVIRAGVARTLQACRMSGGGVAKIKETEGKGARDLGSFPCV